VDGAQLLRVGRTLPQGESVCAQQREALSKGARGTLHRGDRLCIASASREDIVL